MSERSGQTARGHPKEAPKLTKPWLGQGCFLGGRGAEALDLAKGELLLRYREVPLELGDTRFEGIQLPQDHVGGRLTYVAHERLRHPGSSSHQQRLRGIRCGLSAGLARRKGRPAPRGIRRLTTYRLFSGEGSALACAWPSPVRPGGTATASG